MSIVDVQKKLLQDIVANSTEPLDVLYAEEKLKRLDSMKPLFVQRYASTQHESIVYDHNLSNREAYMDMISLSVSMKDLAKNLTDDFNNNTTELNGMTNDLKKLSSIVTDLSLISAENEYSAIYFKDSFINKDNIDTTTGVQCDVLSNEGVAVLQVSGAQEFKSKVFDVKGNGIEGNYNVVRETKDPKNADTIVYEYISEIDAHDKRESMVDKEPVTWYEYQALKPQRELTSTIYDATWHNNTDLLRLKIVLDLEKVQTINWISLNPYYPDNSKRRMSINSIRVSEDGTNYSSINGSMVLNEEINLTPQTYIADNAFSKSLNSKGLGIWNFPAKNARYIEFVIDQVEPYKELVGHTFYATGTETSNILTVIPEKDVPEKIVQAPLGKYPTGEGSFIKKDMMTIDAWRLCVGIRDIIAYGYTFTKQSELSSIQYISQEPISSISLLVNEVIPEEFLTDLSKRNDWIQYYVSIDDVNWHRISPMSHRPYSTAAFPPKLITINGGEVSDELNVLNINSAKDIHTVRLKVVMKRPEDDKFKMYTPVLHDYAIRCTTI